MTKLFDGLLTETDENDAVNDDTPPVTTKTLQELAESPASELFVLKTAAGHSRRCWAKRWIRRFRISLAFVFGAYLVVQVGGILWLRAMLQTLDQRTANTVEEVLKKHGLISSGGQPAPTTGVSVATLPLKGGPIP